MTTLERELKRGTLEMLLLHILADEPTYGYELLGRLSRQSDGWFSLKEGTLYPVLYRLEDAGLIEAQWDKPARGVPRKIYQLTVAGRERLAEMTAAWRSFSSATDTILNGLQVEEDK